MPTCQIAAPAGRLHIAVMFSLIGQEHSECVHLAVQCILSPTLKLHPLLCRMTCCMRR